MTRTQQLLLDDPLWLITAKAVVLFVFAILFTLLGSWAERRIVGRMQQRPGPNRVGPFGALQGLADGLKLALKEDIRPDAADRFVYPLAPMVALVPAFLALSVVPFGGEVTIFGEPTALQLVDLPVGVLVVLACSSIGVYGIVLAGWSSGSPYPLLGALRATAQVISYEIVLGLSVVAVVLHSGSLSTADIVSAQHGGWYVLLLAPSFVLFCIAMVGETNRAPLDLPEAESELVGGFHTEYSSLKFAVYMLAEYTNMATLSAMAATLFLGGPAPAHDGWWGPLWVLLKIGAFFFGFVWLRGTLPRLRYDQFMRMGWRVLIPISLLWILVVTGVRTVRNTGGDPTAVLVTAGIVVGALVALAVIIPARRSATPADAREPTYPVPPADLVVPRKG
ncbi:NADH-quinone oxidoreductase subunit NuoH [Actinomycetes bacterium KLBMP 9759]